MGVLISIYWGWNYWIFNRFERMVWIKKNNKQSLIVLVLLIVIVLASILVVYKGIDGVV